MASTWTTLQALWLEMFAEHGPWVADEEPTEPEAKEGLLKVRAHWHYWTAAETCRSSPECERQFT